MERAKDVIAIGSTAIAGVTTWFGVLNDVLATISLISAIALAWLQIRVWWLRLRSQPQKED